MKYIYRCILAFVFLCIVSFVYSIYNWTKLPEHLPFPVYSFEESGSFGAAENGFPLVDINVIPQTSFVRCLFVKEKAGNRSDNQVTYYDTIIDIEKGKRVFTSEYKETKNPKGYRRWYMRYAVNENSILPLFRYHQDVMEISILLPMSQRPFFFREAGELYEIWSLQNEQEVQVDLPPSWLRSIEESNHFLGSSTVSAKAGFPGLGEFVFTGNQFEMIHVWKDGFSYDASIIEPGLYTSRDLNNNVLHFHFLRQSTPVTVSFSNALIYDTIPPISDRVDDIYIDMISPVQSKHKIFIAGHPENPVYEFHKEKLYDEAPKIDAIFQRLGKGFQQKPIMALEDGEILLFVKDSYQFSTRETNGPVPYHFTKRVRKEGGSLGGYEIESKPVVIKEKPRRFSDTPLDNEHLVYYSDNEIWKMKWDGTRDEKVFPKE